MNHSTIWQKEFGIFVACGSCSQLHEGSSDWLAQVRVFVGNDSGRPPALAVNNLIIENREYPSWDALIDEVFYKDNRALVHNTVRDARLNLEEFQEVKLPPAEQLTAQYMEACDAITK